MLAHPNEVTLPRAAAPPAAPARVAVTSRASKPPTLHQPVTSSHATCDTDRFGQAHLSDTSSKFEASLLPTSQVSVLNIGVPAVTVHEPVDRLSLTSYDVINVSNEALLTSHESVTCISEPESPLLTTSSSLMNLSSEASLTSQASLKEIGEPNPRLLVTSSSLINYSEASPTSQDSVTDIGEPGPTLVMSSHDLINHNSEASLTSHESVTCVSEPEALLVTSSSLSNRCSRNLQSTNGTEQSSYGGLTASRVRFRLCALCVVALGVVWFYLVN